MENSAILGKQWRERNCSVPLQKLCVKSMGRTSAHINCCGFVAINGVVADIRLGEAPGERSHLVQPGWQKRAHHLPTWPDLPSSFLPTLELCWCCIPPRAIPSSARLGCLRGAVRTSGCAGRGQGISVPGGTDPAWACSSIREDHERVFGWGQQLFVIPHPGFKYNCLLQMNDWSSQSCYEKVRPPLWIAPVCFPSPEGVFSSHQRLISLSAGLQFREQIWLPMWKNYLCHCDDIFLMRWKWFGSFPAY